MTDDLQARLDAVEAQRDRLAAAIQAMPCYRQWVEHQKGDPSAWADYDCLRGRDDLLCPSCKQKRAALADAPDVVRDVYDDPQAMAAIRCGWDEVQRGEPGTPVSELRRKGGGAGGGVMGVIRNPSDNPEPRWHDAYAEGYKAGRIAALREVEAAIREDGRNGVPAFYGTNLNRLLAEAESGEEVGEVGDDR